MSTDLEHLSLSSELQALVEAAEQSGTIAVDALNDALEQLDLDPAEVERLQHEFEARGIEVVTAEVEPFVEAPGPLAAAEGATDALQLFLREAGRRPLLNAAREVELAKRIERGDAAAKTEMIEANLRFVVSIAKNYRNQGLPFLGLVQ